MKSIIDLDISENNSWFKDIETNEERSGNINVLAEIIF